MRYPDVTAGCKTTLRLDFLPIVEDKCRRNKRKRATGKFDLEQIKSILSTSPYYTRVNLTISSQEIRSMRSVQKRSERE